MHGFSTNIHDNDMSDISILDSTFIIIMQDHVEMTIMYYCIYLLDLCFM